MLAAAIDDLAKIWAGKFTDKNTLMLLKYFFTTRKYENLSTISG